jgi:hypothetical protein
MFKETELWKEMNVIGKVILTEDEIEITGFTFAGVDMDQARAIVLDWAREKLNKAFGELLDPKSIGVTVS